MRPNRIVTLVAILVCVMTIAGYAHLSHRTLDLAEKSLLVAVAMCLFVPDNDSMFDEPDESGLEEWQRLKERYPHLPPN